MNEKINVSQQEKCETFARLHEREKGFIIPNPWDAGSARLLQGLGFEALATSSAGFAYTKAKTDGDISLEEKLAHCRELAKASDIPINADFENGFADDPQEVYDNLLKVAETGVAGCSIEDFSREHKSIYEFELAVERIQAAVEAVATLNIPFQLTARAENLLHGLNDLDDTLKRLQAFEKAGANVLYAPGLKSLSDLKLVCDSVNKPVNVLGVFFPNSSVQELYEAGAQRISVGAAFARAALRPFLDAGKELLEQGSFGWAKHLASGEEIEALFKS